MNRQRLQRNFEDRSALVTGGGSGLGEATARLLAERGAKVALVGRTREKLERVAEAIRADGGEALVTPADISAPDEIGEACRRAAEAHGGLQLVFANAGINGVWAPLDELAPDEWEKTLRINLTGTYLTIRSTLPFLKRNGGAVVITSSVNGTRIFSNSGASAYACSKAGQVALSRMLALELAEDRIRVNTICPGAIESEIHERTEHRDLEKAREPVEYPAGKIPLTDGEPGTGADVAHTVAFLLSEEARHISGAEIFIDGAESLLMG